MSYVPLQVIAMAVICRLVVPPLAQVKPGRVQVIDVMHPTVTVTVCRPRHRRILIGGRRDGRRACAH